MYNKRFLLYATLMATVLLLVMSFSVGADPVARISTDELNSRLGEDGLLVLDVRSNQDWITSEVKIATAERVEVSDLDQWAANHSKEQTIILYCS